MTPVDHLFIVLLFVVQPIHGAWSYRRYVRKVEAGEPADRVKLYREIIIMEWVAVAVLAAAWIYFGRPASDLGFVAPGGVGFWAGAAILAVVCGLLVYGARRVKAMGDEERAKQREAMGDLMHFLPRTDRDFRFFVYTSITAGIVEEIVYRGFVFWYLAHFLPIWAVVVVAALIFGLGHSYQGVSGMFRVSLIGVAFGVFYVLTGSIWLPILGHALLDILQGVSIVEIMRKRPARPAAMPSA